MLINLGVRNPFDHSEVVAVPEPAISTKPTQKSTQEAAEEFKRPEDLVTQSKPSRGKGKGRGGRAPRGGRRGKGNESTEMQRSISFD